MDNANAIQATGTFVTNKGFNLITKLAAAQATLEFTRAAVGTGKAPEGYAPESMIGLNAYKMDAEISDYGVQDDMAYVTAQISSDNVQEGFLATEVGIFAEDPDEGEILYGYMDISTDSTYIYANGSSNRSKFAEFTLYMLIGSVSSVVAAVTPGSIITKETFRAENMQATDTYGLLGEDEGAASTGQAMMDAIVNRIMTQLVTNASLMEQLGAYILKSKIVNNFLATDAETVLSGPMGKSLKEQIDVLNTKLISQKENVPCRLDREASNIIFYKAYGIVCVQFSFTLAWNINKDVEDIMCVVPEDYIPSITRWICTRTHNTNKSVTINMKENANGAMCIYLKPTENLTTGDILNDSFLYQL